MAERFPFYPLYFFNSLPARNSLNPGDRNTSPRLEGAVANKRKSAFEEHLASLPLEVQAEVDKYKSAFGESSVTLRLANQAVANKRKSAFEEHLASLPLEDRVEELKRRVEIYEYFLTECETSSAVQLQGSSLDVGALATSAGVHGFPLDHCLNNGTHDPLSQNTLDKLLGWLKENISQDPSIRDPTLLKTLFGSAVFLSAGMISKYTLGSLPVEILQSLAIGSAIVGVIASATGLYLIFRQRRSLPFGFERETSIQTLEDVGVIAMGFAFVGGMSLLLPNNLSRCIVAGVLCAVLFLIIIFAKLRPKKEAQTELAGSQGPTDLASNPIMVAIELANLSGAIYSPGAI